MNHFHACRLVVGARGRAARHGGVRLHYRHDAEEKMTDIVDRLRVERRLCPAPPNK